MTGVLVTAEIEREVLVTESGDLIVETPLIGPQGPSGEDPRLHATYFLGSAETVEPLIAALPEGTEYRWDKTDGAGLLLDIVTGVA